MPSGAPCQAWSSVLDEPGQPAGAASVVVHMDDNEAADGVDNSTLARMLNEMKTIGVTELRQRAAEVIDAVRQSGEPAVILQRSRKVAYLINAEQYEAKLAELAATRRALFLREVREAEVEYVAGESKRYDDVESLLDDLRP